MNTWYIKNKEKILAKNKEYRLKNKEKLKEKSHINYLKNKEKILIHNKKYRQKNIKRIREWYNIHNKKTRQFNIEYKLKEILRARIGKAVERKSDSTLNLIGCSIEELKIHLEKQFKEGMNWQNHTKDGWHIDHIIPCCKFDLTKEEEQKKCFHYTNLQPLWAKENLQKNKNIILDKY